MASSYEHERSFQLFGTDVRLLIGAPTRADLPAPDVAAVQLESFLRGLHKRLTRFDDSSELSAMNANPADRCEVSPLLALAVRAGLWAAEETGGLVDPTLVGELEHNGYAQSRVGVAPAPLAEALAATPERHPASPRPDARWREFTVDQARGTVTRPPGVRFDTGGSGKGLAADLGAGRLEGYEIFAVDAGGDLRIGGAQPVARVVDIENPLGDEPAVIFNLSEGAVATSGLASRVWRQGDGYAHHLLDPATGAPAWTGVVQASSLGTTALEAETIAKAALLSGPERGREILDERGGLLILDDGTIEVIGPLADITIDARNGVAA